MPSLLHAREEGHFGQPQPMTWSPYYGTHSAYSPYAPAIPFPGPDFNRELSASAATNNDAFNGHSYMNNFMPSNTNHPLNEADTGGHSGATRDTNSNSNTNNDDSDDENRPVDWNRVRQVIANL